MRTMRLRCPCERNLADVTHSDYNATFTPDGLMVVARPGVDQRDYRPWEAALHGLLPREELAKDPANWQAHTYTWYCRCGATIVRRHQRITELWQQHADNPQRLVTVILKDDE